MTEQDARDRVRRSLEKMATDIVCIGQDRHIFEICDDIQRVCQRCGIAPPSPELARKLFYTAFFERVWLSLESAYRVFTPSEAASLRNEEWTLAFCNVARPAKIVEILRIWQKNERFLPRVCDMEGRLAPSDRLRQAPAKETTGASPGKAKEICQAIISQLRRERGAE